MIAFDTNALVRMLIEDDPDQVQRQMAFEKRKAVISTILGSKSAI